MEWRIGIHLGDVLVEGDDILGDGVNIAARLEGIAEPGSICISEAAYRQVRGKIEAEFTGIGEQTLKNIERPLRVYRPFTEPTAAARRWQENRSRCGPMRAIAPGSASSEVISWCTTPSRAPRAPSLSRNLR